VLPGVAGVDDRLQGPEGTRIDPLESVVTGSYRASQENSKAAPCASAAQSPRCATK
jgi:hypothetical protein